MSLSVADGNRTVEFRAATALQYASRVLNIGRLARAPLQVVGFGFVEVALGPPQAWFPLKEVCKKSLTTIVKYATFIVFKQNI